MPTLRRNFGAGVVGGKIYIIGGTVFDKQFGKQVSTGLVEAYDPLTNRWERHADMLTKRHRIDAAVVNGKVYILGGQVLPAPGFDLADRFLTRIEVYYPKTDQWRRGPDMPMSKFSFSTVVVDNEIYTIGGYSLDNVERLDTVDVYDPIHNRWRPTEPMLTAKTAMATVVNGTIYLIGSTGNNDKFSPVVEAFDTGFRAVSPKDKRSTQWGTLKRSE
jgi:N-acetylneuraminic acid mutarotase